MIRAIELNFKWHAVIAVVIAFGILYSRATAASYNFVKIADASGPLRDFLGPANLSSRPVLNNRGVVAFWALRDSGGSGIFSRNGGPLTTIADTTGPLSGFSIHISMNDAGTVAFNGRFDDASHAVLTGNGGPLTTVADESGPLSLGLASPSINTVGTVAFNARRQMGDDVVYTSDGAPLKLIAERAGPLRSYYRFAAPDINASGQVAFLGYDSTFFDPGLFVGSGGPVTTIVQRTGIQYLSAPSINDAGAVAYFAHRPEGGLGLYKYEAGVTTTIAYASVSSSPFIGFFDSGRGDNGQPTINNDGMIAFWAELRDRRHGIFFGPDGISDALLLTGDSLFGSTVAYVAYPDLNDRGDVAFVYRLANGEQGIAVAVLVPEPATLLISLLACGAALMARNRGL